MANLKINNRKAKKVIAFAKKNPVFAVSFAILILWAGFWFFNHGGFSNISAFFEKNNPVVGGTILFYGNNCDQCAKVDVFIANNKVADKVAFTRLEVLNDATNANILADKAQICGLNPKQIGVPFLWDGKNCIIGYVDVIKFFQEKIKPVK